MTQKKDGKTASTELKSSFSMTQRETGLGDELVVKSDPVVIDTKLPVLATAAAKMTKAEAIQACQDAGLKAVDIGKWEGYSKLGQYLQELGAVKVAAGQYAYHNQMRRKVMQLCRRTMGKAKDPEHVARLADVMAKLLNDSDSTIKELLKFVHTGVIKEPDDKPFVALPPRGTPVVAVNIQNKVGQKDEEQ
jgi:hypothetical protein